MTQTKEQMNKNSILELALNNIESYNQNNPFNRDINPNEWRQYNLVYQSELEKHFKVNDRKLYYDKVFEKEMSDGQVMLWDS